MRRLLYVPLPDDARDVLQKVAQQQRRRPADQAAVLLEQALAALSSPEDDHRPAVDERNQARDLAEVRR